MKIETLGPSSAALLSTVHARCFDQPWSEAEFAALLHLKSSLLLASRNGNALLGFILSRQALDEAEVLTLCVAPETRGRRIGQKLLERSHAELLRQGVTRQFLEVSTDNQAAQRLYSRAGYSEIARRTGYYRDGSDALILEKTLLERGQA